MNTFVKLSIAFLWVLLTVVKLFAQGGGQVRGFVYDKANGEPIMFANVFLKGVDKGTTTNVDGFFNIADVPAGKYVLVCTYIGYDSTSVNVEIRAKDVLNQNIYLNENSVELEAINVSAKRAETTTDVRISAITLSQRDIKLLPSTGGAPDLAQYLQVLPGVIFTGDQGGQLYIRGGSPVQNKVLLDGMTIYNPFHSIGFFSVFETETIRNVEVLTGAFNAEYGGRTSAVVDITTRDGNKTRYGGLASANPFLSKILLEGPIKKLKSENGGSSSFIFTAKHSYIDQTSPKLYAYADSLGLPYSFTDVYGKLSFSSGTGSKLNLFGFNFDDAVNYEGIAQLDWSATGLGTNFTLVPSNSGIILGGRFAFSDYDILLDEGDGLPRNSSIGGFEAGLNFSIYGDESELKYGFEVNGFKTSFEFYNASGIKIEEIENTTEIAGFAHYRKTIGKLVIDPSIRVHYYASLSDAAIEPRLGVKLNLSDNLRFKFAGGFYSQNLISTVNEQDIVNLFVGFLSSPEQIYELDSDKRTEHNLQKSVHGVVGFEVNLGQFLELNMEGYIKDYTQLVSLNRNKQAIQEPDFRSETGKASGIDVLLKYNKSQLYLWLAYSIAYVNRFDGEQEYPTTFDRRHNLNFVSSLVFGAKKDWEFGARWNLGSGFPFTLTQGFYQNFDFTDGINTDYLTGNGDLGILYADKRNSGRLPYYHRLDVSLKNTINFTKYVKLEIAASVTNLYNRKNIFYFDRVEYERVNQLPILPSLGATLYF